MPVIVEHIHNPTADDQNDLTKTYNDAPDWLKTAEQAGQWMTDILSSSETALYAGRFNDRLIAAAVVQKSESNWHLVWLNVRSVTRDRCVGRRIISELQRMANEHDCSLSAEKPADQQVVEKFPSYLKELMAY
ncbi:acetyl-CoA sensor PanZ family protein [Parendozoicomonas sp. Alg238-R29]|uniref:acetyl-CoA sensor PanZ family protein n=1 Tax=Parendozoicomonas sp. Alg238-R29 TaxID=2993446 RepID=UPI00248ECB8A|nr:acetyl-CoA sensor PanZ family protein [Parendozoicomonas sp. Alg238-R29]